jgi:hypothetical protein
MGNPTGKNQAVYGHPAPKEDGVAPANAGICLKNIFEVHFVDQKKTERETLKLLIPSSNRP